MTTFKKIASSLMVGAIAFIAYSPAIAPRTSSEIRAAETVEAQELQPIDRLSHQQRVWLSALEWCESQGIKTAVNPADSDGTASYYSWQFKPGTFKGFGEQYGLIEKGKTWAEIMVLMKDYDLMANITASMIMDPKVRLESQFPGCTKKLGLPPRTVLQ